MSDTIDVRTNLPDFSRQMAELGRSVKPIVGYAARAAATVFKDAARRIVRRRTGQLRRAIVVRRAKAQSGSVMYTVGIRTSVRGKGRGVKGDVFYWRFLEEGWIPRGPGQRLRGGVRAKQAQRQIAREGGAHTYRYPFLAPAFQTVGQQALKVFYDKLAEKISEAEAQL